jgi:hypothetical protein
VVDRLSVILLYLIGVAGLILVLTSIYLIMPPRGHISLRHALVGRATRHILLWYFSTLSVVGVVYGSLATTIVGLLSLEIASILLLLGAQVIAEYEPTRVGSADGALDQDRGLKDFIWELPQHVEHMARHTHMALLHGEARECDRSLRRSSSTPLAPPVRKTEPPGQPQTTGGFFPLARRILRNGRARRVVEAQQRCRVCCCPKPL